MKKINTPLTKENISSLNAGDSILLTGYIYTARDAAHKELCALLDRGKPLPVDFRAETIYFAGPCPAPEGKIIGSCGPTTSCRMDKFSPKLLNYGLLGMIGKGDRSDEVVEAIKNNGAVYFAAIGGAGALISQCVKSAEVVAFEHLGTEAIRRLYVEDMPLIVAIDSSGNNLYRNR